MFQAHCYRFDEKHLDVHRRVRRAVVASGGLRPDGCWTSTIAACEPLFARMAGRASADVRTRAIARSPWPNFVRVRNASWFHENIVLIGDAAHTAHFSIGSGTKLAMEDAIALRAEVARRAGMRRSAARRSQRYQDERMTEALRLQNAARNSMEWFENVRRYIRSVPEQFAYSLLTRSQRVSHENLRLRDRDVSRRGRTVVREANGRTERSTKPRRQPRRPIRPRRRCSRRSRCAA